MIQQLRPLTRMLAATALWALGLLVLSQLGLGGNVGLHPADPALAPPVPGLSLRESGQRLKEFSAYRTISERPLFATDRKPQPFSDESDSAQNAFSGMLSSVLITEEVQVAIFTDSSGNSIRLKIGEMLPGHNLRLAELHPRRAVLEGPSGRQVMDLRVFDGKGGAAPSPSRPPMTVSDPNAGSSPQTGLGKPEAVVPATASAAEVDQRAQVEAIRQRIAARRATMEAEARQKADQEDKR